MQMGRLLRDWTDAVERHTSMDAAALADGFSKAPGTSTTDEFITRRHTVAMCA